MSHLPLSLMNRLKSNGVICCFNSGCCISKGSLFRLSILLILRKKMVASMLGCPFYHTLDNNLLKINKKCIDCAVNHPRQSISDQECFQCTES